MDDRERLTQVIAAMGGRVQTIQFATIPGSPWSKARTRVGKGGRVYQEERDRTAEQVTALHLRKLTRQRGNVAIVAIFYRPDRHRIDADNLLKHVQDAGTGVVWDDDSQVTATAGIVEIDRDQPRTVLAVAAHVSTMRRGTDDITTCAGCGRPVPRRGGRCRECWKNNPRGGNPHD